ncbi:MAG: ATP-binding protein [Betaproteobacteria bacterium]|nr:ATP-binding protein [Betaproteobacteria bacterium]
MPGDGDVTRLAQVFGNLLNNARKYTDPGGLIDLTAAPPGAGSVTVNMHDNGIGIAEAAMPTIFEMFLRRSTARWSVTGGSASASLAL